MKGDSHFIIIGAMKAGTSSLFAWLSEVPEVSASRIKEPNFFSDEGQWSKGQEWYSRLFEPKPGALTGEASVDYTNPARSLVAAGRIVEVVPQARLIYLVRHPLERAASEYRHQVQRGREERPFAEATADPTTPYAHRSRYFHCLQPFIERFPRQQLLVVRSEDLNHTGWTSVLDHLGIKDRPRPPMAHNVTDSKRGYSPFMRFLFDRGLTNRLEQLPAPIRRIGRKFLFRSDPAYRTLLATSQEPVSAATAESIWADVTKLESWLGTDPLWDRSFSRN